MAQFVPLWHHFHRLVHWLVKRLRLDKEPKADALAAQLAVGPQIFHLAELAIR